MAHLLSGIGFAACARWRVDLRICGCIAACCAWGLCAAMARQQWIIELKKAGLNTSDERLAVVAQFLVDNYLTSLKRLRAVGNPASWPGSAVFA